MTRYVQNIDSPKKDTGKSTVTPKPKPGTYSSKELESGKKIYSGNGGKY